MKISKAENKKLRAGQVASKPSTQLNTSESENKVT